jgi:hypothetical protein
MQTLVFSSLENPDWRYTDLVSTALNVGVKVTKQGLEDRFTEKSAHLARRVLEIAVQTVIGTEKTAMPLLERFNGVYIRDSSVVSLPKALETVWPGCNTSQGSSAAVKLHTRLEVSSGQLGGPILAAGREHDSASPFQTEQLPPGAMRMGDLGFYSLEQFAADSKQGIFWFSRYKTGTLLFSLDNQLIDLRHWLSQQKSDQVELPVLLGKTHHLASRLLAIHVPNAVAEKRRAKLREYARKKQTPLTDNLLALAEWTLILTNIPENLLSIPEASVLLRVRWQIELLFKRWKSLFKIDQWRSKDIWRILTEMYAKLISIVVANWIQMTGMWQTTRPSLWKSVLVIRKFATSLALVLPDLVSVEKILMLINCHFNSLCRLDTRRRHPSIYQLLENSSCRKLA